VQAPASCAEAITTEYRQSGVEAVRVSLIPTRSFETKPKPLHVGTGLKTTVRLDPGLACVSSWLSCGAEPTVTVGSNGGLIRIGFNLSRTPLRGSINGIGGEMRFGDTYACTPPTETTVIYVPFCRMRILTLFVLPSVLTDLVDQEAAIVPERLIARLAGCGPAPLYQMTRMTSEMHRVVERIDPCPFSGGLRRLYVEGKVLELLALRLAQLGEPARGGPVEAGRRFSLSRRHVGRLQEAREIVESRIASPPSLRELSREVALSTTLLKSGFRELFGETVFEHLRNLRLAQARERLAEPDASVKEVAQAVGYASLSHFAKAFRSRYGASPRAWRGARGSA
jgi:AraC-like DNA-binding protein